MLKLPSHMKILVVDDQKTMRRIIKNLIHQLNVTNVDEASDGQDALQKLLQNRYDVILSDWNMSPMTGLEFLQYVRRDATYRHKQTPFIMITAETRPENIEEAVKSGVDNYITKPFDADTLQTKVIQGIIKRKKGA